MTLGPRNVFYSFFSLLVMALEKLKNCFKDEDVRANYATAGLNDNSAR